MGEIESERAKRISRHARAAAVARFAARNGVLMQRDQNQTLGLVFLLLLVLAAGVFAPAIVAFLTSVFQYHQVQTDLNPLNPNFDWSQLKPQINIPTPQINLPSLPSPPQITLPQIPLP
jgi:fatty acid desaturase